MRFHAITFTFLYVAVNGASDPGTTCDSKELACTEGAGVPLGGSAMLQHRRSTQSSQTRTYEPEDPQQRQRVALAAVAKVAKVHRVMRDVRKKLNQAQMQLFAEEPQRKAEVEGLQLELSKAQEELGFAEEAAARFSSPDDKEDEEESDLSLAEETVGASKFDELDLKDLMLLTSATDNDVNLTDAAKAELGWTEGVLVAFEEGDYKDHARTWKKGNHCLATFAATNDLVDVNQVFDTAPMDFCRFRGIHSGVVDELVGFMQSPQWSDFIEFLEQPNCTTVTAVGHSLGGALATLFAASANRRRACDLNFGNRKDYRLVTYAPFAISKSPLYNGRKGRDFDGTRYGITEIDGGVDGSFSLPSDPSVFRLAIVDYLANLSATFQTESATFYARTLNKATRRGYGRIAGRWTKVERLAVDLLPLMQLNLMAPQPPFEFMHDKTMELLMVSMHSGFLNFQHDPVSTLTSFKNVGPRNGYKHPLLAFQPLTHPFKGSSSTIMDRVPGHDAPELPRGDFFQDQLAILASATALPNHQACCYATVARCSRQFTVRWKECEPSPLR